MTLATPIKLLMCSASCALLLGASGCMASEPGAPFSKGFLEHLHSNAPHPLKDCIVAQTRLHWPNERAVYAAHDVHRAARGRTDVVNFAIRKMTPLCRDQPVAYVPD